MQHEADDILRETLECYDDGALEEGDLSAYSLVLEQFHHAVADRRAALGALAADMPRSGSDKPISPGIVTADTRITSRSK